MRKFTHLFDTVSILILAAVIVVSFVLLSPLYQPTPHRDSGIFLYIGSELLHGKVLYQQAWDHKQPLIYWLNAAGLALGGSVWGVWAIELVLFLIGFLAVYWLLRKKLNPLFALLISSASFLTVFQVMSGNFTEEYAIAFDLMLLACLFLLYLPAKTRLQRVLAAAGLGILAALPFCLKQTYINTVAAVGFFFLLLAWVEKDRKRLFDLLWYCCGFVLVNLIVVVYFLSRGALHDYIVTAYLFNGPYSKQGLLEWLHAFAQVLAFNSSTPLVFLAAALWFGALLFLVPKFIQSGRTIYQKLVFRVIVLLLGIASLILFAYAQIKGKAGGIGLMQGIALVAGILLCALAAYLFLRKPVQESPSTSSLFPQAKPLRWTEVGYAPLAFLGMFDFPISAVLISLSGENFPHYYISLLPGMFLLLAAAVLFIEDHLHTYDAHRLWTCFLIGLFMAGMFAPISGVVTRLKSTTGGDERSAAAAFLKESTSPEDKVLIWGWGLDINFMADREAPSKYAMQFPLYLKSPYQAEAQATLLNDLKANPPLYIVDTMETSQPFIQGETMQQCLAENPSGSSGIPAILNYVCSHYEYVKSIGSMNFYQVVK